MNWKGAVSVESPKPEREPSSAEPVAGDVLKRARAYIAEMPEAVEGDNGSRICFNVARKLADFGLTEGQVFQVLRDDYNSRCRPPWSEQELEHKAHDAVAKRREKNPIPDRPKPSNGDAQRGHEPTEPPADDYEHTDDDAPDAEPPQPIALCRIADLIGPALERAERRRSGEELPVPTPFASYNEALGGGFFPGSHQLVSGTAVGKSQLSIQTGLGAAKAGIPVVYIGLELDEMQIALRVLGEHVSLRWSSLYLGRCSQQDLARAREASADLLGLPFYADFGPPNGWPASRLIALAEQTRKQHPSGPMLFVLDYLQLIGSEPLSERRQDRRELIGSAAYLTRDVARRFGAAVQVVSSAARNHYGLLASDVSEAGLVTRKLPGHIEPIRTILQPHVLVGLGKESGECEYSADSVTVLVRWPVPLDNGETAVVCAVPKLRAGPPRWLALRFWGSFHELPVKDVGDLPELPARGGKGKAVSSDDMASRVIETVRRHPHLSSKSQIAEATKGTKSTLLRVIGELLEQDKIGFHPGGCEVREEPNR